MLKEEILRELEKRVSLSCSSCQVSLGGAGKRARPCAHGCGFFQAGVESLLRQQQKDQERIGALEKQLNLMDVLQTRRPDLQPSQTCCDGVGDLQTRVSQNERKISSAVESLDGARSLLERALRGRVGGANDSGASGVVGGLDQLKDLEQQINKSCSDVKKELKSSAHRELEDLRAHFQARSEHHFSRVTAVETDLGLLKEQLDNQHQKLLSLEEDTSLLAGRIHTCACMEPENGEGGEGGEGGRSVPHGGLPGNKTGGEGEAPGQVGGASGGRWSGKGGERGNTTEKSLEWRVVANENQIRHFSTRLKDLSVSGDSLTHKVRPSTFTTTTSSWVR